MGPADTSKNASHHYSLDEIKAAIGVLTTTVEQLNRERSADTKPDP
jgi:hypothetical protein